MLSLIVGCFTFLLHIIHYLIKKINIYIQENYIYDEYDNLKVYFLEIVNEILSMIYFIISAYIIIQLSYDFILIINILIGYFIGELIFH